MLLKLAVEVGKVQQCGVADGVGAVGDDIHLDADLGQLQAISCLHRDVFMNVDHRAIRASPHFGAFVRDGHAGEGVDDRRLADILSADDAADDQIVDHGIFCAERQIGGIGVQHVGELAIDAFEFGGAGRAGREFRHSVASEASRSILSAAASGSSSSITRAVASLIVSSACRRPNAAR